jgi:hypothetical protein
MTEDQIAHLADKLGDWTGYSPTVMRGLLESALVDMPKAAPAADGAVEGEGYTATFGGGNPFHIHMPSVDLRDRFAMAAVGGLLAFGGCGGFQETAEAAGAIADAMMKERGS